MPTKLAGAVRVLEGRGRKVCTIADFTKHADDMKLGPDGQRWEVYTAEEITPLLSDLTFSASHNAVGAIHHLCAGQSKWAFTVPGLPDSLPQGVAFLYVKKPAHLAALAGGGGTTYTFNGALLKRGYDQADATWGSHIWRRIHVNGAIEIAINFCVPLIA